LGFEIKESPEFIVSLLQKGLKQPNWF